jgi:hypothetical protein
MEEVKAYILITYFPYITEEARRYDSKLILKQLIC